MVEVRGDGEPGKRPKKASYKASYAKRRCVIPAPECGNDSSKDLSFKRFPSHDEPRCKMWIQLCGQRKLSNLPLEKAGSYYVCEEHFPKSDFLEGGRLKNGAIPSLKLPASLSETDMRNFARQATVVCNNSVNAIVPVVDAPVRVPEPELQPKLQPEPARVNNLLCPQDYSDRLVPDPVHVVMAPTHQGSLEFGVAEGGKQCCAMSVEAIAMATCSRHPAKWDTHTMQMILMQGNVLYQRSVRANTNNVFRYLYADEVVTNFYVYSLEVTLSVGVEVMGSHHGRCEHAWIARSLITALEEQLSIPGSSGVLITSYDYTVAVWKMDGHFWLFDSHGRDERGKIAPVNGRAFCGCYRSLEDLCWAYYQNFRNENGEVKEGYFQITPITITPGQDHGHIIVVPTATEQPLVPERAPPEQEASSTPPPAEGHKTHQNRGQKRKRSKENIPRVWYKRPRVELKRLSLKDILLHAGIGNHENADQSHMKLAQEIQSLRALLRAQQNTMVSLRQKVNKLERLSIKEFLERKNVSWRLIKAVECAATNSRRKPRGRRYCDDVKAISISSEKAGGRGGHSVAQQILSLPSLRTTRKITQLVDLDCGFHETSPFVRILQDFSSNMPETHRIVGFGWDETELVPCLTLKDGTLIGYEDYGFDDCGNRDRTEKLADKLLVVHVKGLFTPWHYPIAYAFASRQTSKERLRRLLLQLIRAVTQMGLRVWFFCCDQGSSNTALMHLLEREFPHVQNGVRRQGSMCIDGNIIYVTFDPAHMIKCFRNLLVGGYLEWPITVNNVVFFAKLEWSLLERLCQIVENFKDRLSSTSLASKITRRHLDSATDRRRKMKVKPARQLFSNTNVQVLLQVGEPLLPGSADAAMVIKDIDQLIDLTCGHTSKDARAGKLKECKEAISDDSVHRQLLPQFMEKLRNARFFRVDQNTGRVTRKSTPTPASWIITSQSHLALADRCKEFVDKLNPRTGLQTDDEECFFSSLKAQVKQGNKLTPIAAVGALKGLLIRNMVVPDNPHSNVESTGITAYDSVNLFLSKQPPLNFAGPASEAAGFDDSDDPDDPEYEGDFLVVGGESLSRKDMITSAMAGAGLLLEDMIDQAIAGAGLDFGDMIVQAMAGIDFDDVGDPGNQVNVDEALLQAGMSESIAAQLQRHDVLKVLRKSTQTCTRRGERGVEEDEEEDEKEDEKDEEDEKEDEKDKEDKDKDRTRTRTRSRTRREKKWGRMDTDGYQPDD
ncbi:hypothetical protein ONE63_001016 [Megalurothrips usitatus]|uniref:THAP-type domain-containing protein n=1 Tax=Megalurothrips usitatus TaxID=439358 RepID=A0AAV7XFE7_9NEOP|nr:hypothetical protein ONE63_001016 [Megalurothrips usitatus]